MKGNNPTRDLSKSVTASSTTTPVTYRSTAAVYRSLAAVPMTLDVEKHQQRAEKPFAALVGPQQKQKGEVVWAETRKEGAPCKELRPVPIPLIVANAPHNTLYIESNPVSKVVAAVHELFEQHHVDTVFNEAKFKWKCSCYNAQVETHFVSRLFSVPDKDHYFVLDFQRRGGDPLHFQSIYKSINFKLLKSGFVVSCSENKAMVEPQMRSFRPLALPDDFFGESCEEEKCATDFEPLCRMCLSPFIDVQREGLIALANQLDQDENARKCLASFAEKLVEAVCLSRDMHVRRVATAALAALSVEASAHRHIKEKGGLRALAKLLIDETELPETRRQAARVLTNVQDWDAETKNMVRGASIAKDARLTEMLTSLQACAN